MNKNYIIILIKIFSKELNNYKYEVFETYKNKSLDNLKKKIERRIMNIKYDLSLNIIGYEEKFVIEYEIYENIPKLEEYNLNE
jgi:hypothetical protein